MCLENSHEKSVLSEDFGELYSRNRHRSLVSFRKIVCKRKINNER